MLPFRKSELYLVILLPIIGLLNFLDIIEDIKQEADKLHLTLEVLQVIIVIIVMTIMFKHAYKRRAELTILQNKFDITHRSLKQSKSKIDKLNDDYMKVIQQQLAAWQLTPSEKEVAILLLKGLSFDEISNVRKTKEKTVRQQASSIYRKSGLSGRHEFSAWFFEDLLG